MPLQSREARAPLSSACCSASALAGQDAAVLRALLAQHARQAARVDVGDADHAVLLQVDIQRICSLRKLLDQQRQVADHQAGGMDRRRIPRPRRLTPVLPMCG